MRRVRINWMDQDGAPSVHEFKCRSASYGPDSRNIVLYEVMSQEMGGRITDERMLITLAPNMQVRESEW